MKRDLLLITAILCFLSCNAQQKSNQQQTPPTNWAEYRIPNVCTFAIPPSMELRDKNSLFGKSTQLYEKALTGSGFVMNVIFLMEITIFHFSPKE